MIFVQTLAVTCIVPSRVSSGLEVAISTFTYTASCVQICPRKCQFSRGKPELRKEAWSHGKQRGFWLANFDDVEWKRLTQKRICIQKSALKLICFYSVLLRNDPFNSAQITSLNLTDSISAIDIPKKRFFFNTNLCIYSGSVQNSKIQLKDRFMGEYLTLGTFKSKLCFAAQTSNFKKLTL